MGIHGGHHHLITAAPQLPPPSPSETSFPILAISIVGILATAILLLSYYVFVIKCCITWQRSDVLSRLTRSQRRWRTTDRYVLSSLHLSADTDRGLDESTIQAIPTLGFRKGEQQNSSRDCAVCLNEFQEEERIRMLPNCLHLFHIDCIDTWLQTHANCPLCRAKVTGTSLVPVMQPNLHRGEVAIDVRDEASEHQTSRTDAGSDSHATRATNACVGKRRKLHKISSLGDECIDLRGGKDEQFAVHPMRRSFSMDSSSDTQLYSAVQEILKQNPHFREAGNGEGTSTGSGRPRRPFFSFSSHCRSSKSTVLPVRPE